MNRCCSFAVLMGLVFLAAPLLAAEPEKTRNPFDVTDVKDPDGNDVKEFAEKNKPAGDDKDDNAKQWPEKASEGKANSLAGEWPSRWNRSSAAETWFTGTAKVKVVGERVYILYKDNDGGTYLIDAKRVGKNQLVGRYVNVGDDNDSSPWVGTIVNNERIDGAWGDGRWDLRRKLEGEKKPK